MEKKKKFLINIAYYGFFAGVLYMALQYLLPALMPFLLAAVFAALVQKPGEKLAAGIGCGKKPAAILLLVCFYLLLLGVIILCGGQIIAAVGDMKRYGLNVLKVYLKSYSLLFLMTFAELTVGFMILKIPYAVVAALAIAVFDILPVLGTGGVLLPWAVIMLVLGDYPLAIGILILYIVITIIRNMIEPRIVGKQIGLHPLITLIAMFVGLQLFGLAGMILLPMTAVVLSGMLKNGELVSP